MKRKLFSVTLKTKINKLSLFAFIFLFGICNYSFSQNWVQQGNNMNGEAAGDDFGRWASISADGNTVAAGAQSNDGNGFGAGHVRIFTYNGSSWIQKGSDIDGVAAEDQNSRVALSADGNTVAVGAPLNDDTGNGSGHVRVFDYDGANWVQRGANIPSETANDQAGTSVGISADGNRVVIGSRDHRSSGSRTGQARVFGWNGSSWVKLGSDLNGEAMSDEFGGAVQISADGNTIIVGAQFADPAGNGSGEVSVFEYDGSEWVAKGNDIPGEQINSNFGNSVDISADGNTIIAGAAEQTNGNGDRLGRVRIFSWNGTQWVQKGSNIEGIADGDRIGIRSAINSTGNIIAVKGLLGVGNVQNLSGNARIFLFNGTDWVQLGQTIYGEAADNAGFGLDFNETGDTISIGFPMNDASGQDAGQLRVYKLDIPLGTNQNYHINFAIYPNPSNGNFTIDLGKEFANVSIHISNMLGQKISSSTYPSIKIIEQEINAPSGIYFVTISTSEGISKTMKIIKN